MVDVSPDDEVESGSFSEGRSRHALSAFTDLGFRTTTAEHVVPLLYGAILASVLGSYVVVAVLGFKYSLLLGLFWLIVAGPAVCIAIALGVRVGLEMLLVTLAMSRQVDELNEIVLELAELMVGVAAKIEVIPTLPSFGRGGRTRRRSAIMDMRDRIIARRSSEYQ